MVMPCPPETGGVPQGSAAGDLSCLTTLSATEEGTKNAFDTPADNKGMEMQLAGRTAHSKKGSKSSCMFVMSDVRH